MNDPEPNPLRDHLDRLPREITPARDLWPEIESRLGAAAVAKIHPFRRWRLPLAIAAVLVLAATLSWWRPAPTGPSWAVDNLSGTPRIGRTGLGSSGQLRVGQWLETDATSRAKVTVGTIGEVSLDPNSRLRLVDNSTNNHRLELARGTLHAMIWAPPRLFFVETPSATAVDLGCAYTLTVDDRGAGTLEVTAGYVALEYGGLESIVPAGLVCLTRPGSGPGTPFAADAAPELRAALARFDAGDQGSLPGILAATGEGDGVTLWHLLVRAPEADRGRVFDRLASLHPPPAGVARSGIITGDRLMRDLWAEEIGLPVGLNSDR